MCCGCHWLLMLILHSTCLLTIWGLSMQNRRHSTESPIKSTLERLPTMQKTEWLATSCQVSHRSHKLARNIAIRMLNLTCHAKKNTWLKATKWILSGTHGYPDDNPCYTSGTSLLQLDEPHTPGDIILCGLAMKCKLNQCTQTVCYNMIQIGVQTKTPAHCFCQNDYFALCCSRRRNGFCHFGLPCNVVNKRMAHK